MTRGLSAAAAEAEWLKTLSAEDRESIPSRVDGWLRRPPREAALANMSQEMVGAAKHEDLRNRRHINPVESSSPDGASGWLRLLARWFSDASS